MNDRFGFPKFSDRDRFTQLRDFDRSPNGNISFTRATRANEVDQVADLFMRNNRRGFAFGRNSTAPMPAKITLNTHDEKAGEHMANALGGATNVALDLAGVVENTETGNVPGAIIDTVATGFDVGTAVTESQKANEELKKADEQRFLERR